MWKHDLQLQKQLLLVWGSRSFHSSISPPMFCPAEEDLLCFVTRSKHETWILWKMQLFQCKRNNWLLSNVISYDKKSKIAHEQSPAMIGKGWTLGEPLQRGLHPRWIASAGLLEFDTATMTVLSVLNESFVFFTCMENGCRADHI